MVDNATEQKRETDGRYAFDGNYDRLCVCGHTLGVHGAGSPADCLLYSFNPVEQRREIASGKHINAALDCGCSRFRLSRKKHKAVCTCLREGECDCQNPEPINGVALRSNECPVHTWNPYPNPECPVHGSEADHA